MEIFLNGQKQLDLKNGGTATIIVPNGRHTLCGRNKLSSKNCGRNAIVLNLTSERAVVNATFNMWSMSFWAPVKLTDMARFPLDKPNAPYNQPDSE